MSAPQPLSWSFASTTPVDSNLICPICSDPFQCPRKLQQCGHYFCRPCITSWVRENPICAVCRAPVSTTQNAISSPDRLIVSMLDDLRVQCDVCSYAGKKNGHCCPQFTCDFEPCSFLGSDEDEVRRHQVVCRYAGNGGGSSGSESAKLMQQTREREAEEPWWAQPDNLIAGGIVVADIHITESQNTTGAKAALLFTTKATRSQQSKVSLFGGTSDPVGPGPQRERAAGFRESFAAGWDAFGISADMLEGIPMEESWTDLSMDLLFKPADKPTK
ncbi:hypothetical protein HDU98_005881 [Podochytrium sp. JEL0797]|nr:hypothetical protein HDU98_005881 [Podochytrium sp. JEL0797]